MCQGSSIYFIKFIFIFSSLAAIIIYASYLLGFVVSWLLVKYQNKADLYLQQITNIYRDCLLTRKRVTNSCSICDDLSCRRHQRSKSITPWKHLFISKNLNSAVEHVSQAYIFLIIIVMKLFLVL